MANQEIFLQNELFTRFAWPFLLIFFLVFAILEKTKVLGDDKKQVNALVAFVMGLIVISVAYPVEVINNMILFLTVGLVVMFVVLLLWGFAFGDMKEGFNPAGWMKWALGIIAGIAVIVAVLWATGSNAQILDLLFDQGWSSGFWTNTVFVVVVAAALAVILKTGGK